MNMLLSNKNLVKVVSTIILVFNISLVFSAQTIGIFYDQSVPQIKFAAGDVKKVLEAHNFKVQMLPLTALKDNYANKKVVIALASDKATTYLLKSQGAEFPENIVDQGYAIRTTSKPEKTYWVIGGDANGAMYGALQMADNIRMTQLAGNYNEGDSPTILRRGIKLNLPWDKESGTYGINDKGTYDGLSSQLALKDVWDMTFWTQWFDEMARNRYNTVSLWSCNPFSSLVSVPGYEDCSIQDITYFDGTVKKMSIEGKIQFWKEVMAYAHARGFEFLLFNWNVFTYGATGKHGITDGKEGSTNPATLEYMYKSMTKLLETYPDLDGFGLSIGENKGTEDFVWNAYGKAMYDYGKANPKRNLKFIHRLHFGDFPSMVSLFEPLRTLPNISFDISIKHSQAHMYSTPKPNWWPEEVKSIRDNNLKTWCTVRNDDVFYLTWGDPEFARTYIEGMLELGAIFKGFYMGCDGYNPTRSFFNKNESLNGQLEVLRQQYMMMIWGRLSYNPKTSDDLFKNYLGFKYPTINKNDLFIAWSKASRGFQQANEMIQGGYNKDFQWWPEGCQRDATKTNKGPIKPFVTVQDFAKTNVGRGSLLANIADSANGKLNGKKSSYAVADSIEDDALLALKNVKSMKVGPNAESKVAINNIKGLSYLSLYYAYKIRAATYIKANNQEKAKDALGTAYGWWMNYSNVMDSMYIGMTMQRSSPLENWHVHDQSVLKEYTDLGGVGIPNLNK